MADRHMLELRIDSGRLGAEGWNRSLLKQKDLTGSKTCQVLAVLR
jgi:hypothetical protein